LPFDLQPSEEQEALRGTLHEFSEAVLRPASRGAESAKQVPDDLVRQVHEIGVTAPVAEEFGGGGTFDAVTYVIAAEELAWGDAGIAQQVLGSGLAAIVIGEAGTDEQKKKYLPQFAQTEPTKSFVAVGEKVAGGDIETLETSISGDKVTGRK